MSCSSWCPGRARTDTQGREGQFASLVEGHFVCLVGACRGCRLKAKDPRARQHTETRATPQSHGRRARTAMRQDTRAQQPATHTGPARPTRTKQPTAHPTPAHGHTPRQGRHDLALCTKATASQTPKQNTITHSTPTRPGTPPTTPTESQSRLQAPCIFKGQVAVRRSPSGCTRDILLGHRAANAACV